MASSSLDEQLTAEYFSYDPRDYAGKAGDGRVVGIVELELLADAAIERGAFDIADGLISVLDLLDGDTDLEPIDEREPEEEGVGEWGLDQRAFFHSFGAGSVE